MKTIDTKKTIKIIKKETTTVYVCFTCKILFNTQAYLKEDENLDYYEAWEQIPDYCPYCGGKINC